MIVEEEEEVAAGMPAMVLAAAGRLPGREPLAELVQSPSCLQLKVAASVPAWPDCCRAVSPAASSALGWGLLLLAPAAAAAAAAGRLVAPAAVEEVKVLALVAAIHSHRAADSAPHRPAAAPSAPPMLALAVRLSPWRPA